jgi:hypothetical protein
MLPHEPSAFVDGVEMSVVCRPLVVDPAEHACVEAGTEKNRRSELLWDTYEQAWDPEKKIFGLLFPTPLPSPPPFGRGLRSARIQRIFFLPEDLNPSKTCHLHRPVRWRLGEPRMLLGEPGART